MPSGKTMRGDQRETAIDYQRDVGFTRDVREDPGARFHPESEIILRNDDALIVGDGRRQLADRVIGAQRVCYGYSHFFCVYPTTEQTASFCAGVSITQIHSVLFRHEAPQGIQAAGSGWQ